MTTIYFVRHAQPNIENHIDAARELTEKGLRDRLLVEECLHPEAIGAVLSSPYRRAVDTVRPIAERRGLAIELVDDFRERKVGSEWIEDFGSFARRQWADFSYCLPGGESLGAVQARNLRALETVLTAHRGETVVIGTHGTALSTILNAYEPTFGYAQFVEIKNLMPWLVKFTFEGAAAPSIKKINVFAWNGG